MSIAEAALRVLGLAFVAGLIAYAYGHWYFRFALSRATLPPKKNRFLLAVLASPLAVIITGALFIPTLDKPLFKLICDTELLFFGTPISIIACCVPAIFKVSAANRMVWAEGKQGNRRLTRGQSHAMIAVLYLVASVLWLVPQKPTHAPDVALTLIVATGITVLRFAWAPKMAERLTGDDKVNVSRLLTHLVIASWLFAANAIYRAI